MAKTGVNNKNTIPQKSSCTFVVIDNKPHLNENGIRYLCNWVEKLILVTKNPNHPSYSVKNQFNNLEILYYENLDLSVLLEDLKRVYNIERITIQSGGTLNCKLLREKTTTEKSKPS